MKYQFRLELTLTTFGDEELYCYDVYEPHLGNYPDGYDLFMDDHYDNEHISSADNMKIEVYAFYNGKFNWRMEDDLTGKHGDGYTENIDEFRAFETMGEIKKKIKADADKRFPDSGFKLQQKKQPLKN